MAQDDSEHFKHYIVDFKNKQGDSLTITIVGNNKYPTLGIQKYGSNEINKIGTLTNAVAFIRFMKGAKQDEWK